MYLEEGMSCLMEKQFLILKRQKLSSRIGEKNTMRLDGTAVLAINHRHPRRFNL